MKVLPLTIQIVGILCMISATAVFVSDFLPVEGVKLLGNDDSETGEDEFYKVISTSDVDLNSFAWVYFGLGLVMLLVSSLVKKYLSSAMNKTK